jgi:hypothetical protein
MSPLFALDLSLDGIRLLYRAEGGWTVVGDVALEDPALTARLADLRAAAKELAPDGFATELVIPPSQIRYATVPRPHGGTITAEDLLPAVAGLTAIPPEEIAFDFEVDGDDVRLALVDTLTLSEAETFAAAHKFNPATFGARPTPAQFPRPADFGPTARAAAALAAAPAPVATVEEPAPVPTVEESTTVEDTPDPAPAFASIRAAAGMPSEPVAIALPGNLTLSTDAASAPEAAAAPSADPTPDVIAAPAEAPAPQALADAAPATTEAVASQSLADAEPIEIDAPTPATEAPIAAEAPFTEVPAPGDAPDLPEPEDLARTLTAPPPATPEPAAETPAAPARGAAALARTLVAERTPARAPARPARPRAATTAFPKSRRLAVAGAGLAAAIVLALGVTLTRDPADALPDTPPEVALAAPALATPDGAAPGPAPAAPATEAEGVPTTLAASEIAAPETTADPIADTAAPATLEDDAPSLLVASAPAGLPLPATEGTEAIYLASIDPDTATSDAIALPPATLFASSPRPAALPSPAPAGTTFDRSADGLVVATPEGALTPDGVLVRLGPPPLTPPPAPNRPAPDAVAAAPAAAEVVIATTEPEVRPRARPTGLVERFERATLGGRTRAEMAALKPEPRPVSAQAEAVAEAPAEPSDYAVAVSIAPRDRPENFAARVATETAVAAALAAPPPPAPEPAPEPAPVVVAAAPAAAPAPAPAREEPSARARAPEADEYADGEPETASAAPDIPTTASVARQATIRNAMDLGDVNLIGVYGTERDRRALVRLPSGRMVKVEVGDRLDGGRIAAIGRDELRYTKGGRNITLEVPEG